MASDIERMAQLGLWQTARKSGTGMARSIAMTARPGSGWAVHSVGANVVSDIAIMDQP